MSKPSAYQHVTNQFIQELKSGDLTVGQMLPGEQALAARFHVNRATMREAIRLLEDTGYIHRISPRKMQVAMPSTDMLAERTLDILQFHIVSIREIWEANLAIEPHMARIAASRATEAQKQAIIDNVVATRRTLECGESLDTLDLEFHGLLGAASNHLPLQISRAPFSDLFLKVVDGLVHHPDIGKRLFEAHNNISMAIQNDDSEVAELWARRHVLDFERGCQLNGIDMDAPLKLEATAYHT